MNNPHHLENTIDEIDLKDILFFLWNNKGTILTSTLLFALLSISALLFIPPVYKLQFEVLPPDASNVALFQNEALPDSTVRWQAYSAVELFQFFAQTALSESNRIDFFTTSVWPDVHKNKPALSFDSALGAFQHNFSMKAVESASTVKQIRFILKGKNRSTLVAQAQTYLSQVNSPVRKALEEDYGQRKDTVVASYDRMIQLKKKVSAGLQHKRKVDRNEAIQLAQNDGPAHKAKDYIITIDTSSNNNLDYTISLLEHEQNFYAQLPFPKEELSTYQTSPSLETLTAKPVLKRKLIIVLMAQLGMLVGIGVAYFRRARRVNTKQM
jgi:LPS O-antigen subunit length determinant protein (WzzB/FepE family)